MLVSLALSVAQAQTFELTTEDMGTTVPLFDADLAYGVDMNAPDLDLEEVNVLTRDGETSLAELYDNALADGAAIGDRMVLSLGERDELLFALIEEGGGGRVCVPLRERRCTLSHGFVVTCESVVVGSTCCADGTTACGDYILAPE